MHKQKAGRQHYLLQVKLLPPLHSPFHFEGGGLNPSSLKLSDSGQIPVSITLSMISLSAVAFLLIVSESQESPKTLLCEDDKVCLGKQRLLHSYLHITVCKNML